MMENTNKCLVKKPLPGERQGASGASAGCDRMRDVGGMVLRSRAHVNKYASTSKPPPVLSGAPAQLEGVTNLMSNQDVQWSGPSRDNVEKHGIHELIPKLKRIPWTDRDVEELFRCYYIVQKGSSFSQDEFYRTWRSRNPTLRPNMDSKKLGNQRRYFLNSGRMSDQGLERIRKSVTHIMAQQQTESLGQQDMKGDPYPNASMDSQVDASGLVQCQAEKILEEFEKLQGVLMKNRKYIPKIWENGKVAKIIKDVDRALEIIVQDRPTIDLNDINHLAYTAATLVAKDVLGEEKLLDIQSAKPQIGKQDNEPPWVRRISRKIENLRRHLSLLEEYWKGNTTRKKTLKIMKQIMHDYNIRTASDFPTTIEQMKQRIQAYAQRIRRYTKRVNFRKDNSMFVRNPGLFYRHLQNKKGPVTGTPKIEEVTQFWANLWENPSYHNKTANWISEEKQQNISVVDMDLGSGITHEEYKTTLGRMANWKAAGVDGLQAFWFKRFTSLHEPMRRCFNNFLLEGESVPCWLTEGRTFLIQKSTNSQDPSKYRPITCLPVTYKLLTGIISNKIYEHVINAGVLPDEQLGCRRGSFGSKELVLLGRTIVEDAKKKKKNLAVAWLDYQKAFDSVPHDWIIRVMELFKIDQKIIQFCERTMGTWRTRLLIRSKNGMIHSREIHIRRGIFQGDSLSPLLFCLALAPLSRILRTSGQGYELHRNEPDLTHAVYMDDLKLFSASEEGLKKLLLKTGQFSKDICMEMGLNKCARVCLFRGKLSHSENIEEADGEFIGNLGYGESYKYLGIEEDPSICDKKTRENLKQEYLRRLRLILRSQLNAVNKMKAIGAFAVPVLEYSFAIVKWPLEELDNLDRKTRKLLTMHGMLHPRADIDRLYVSRKEGGRGLRQIATSYQVAMVNMGSYLLRNQTGPITSQIIRDQRKPGSTGILSQALKIVAKVNEGTAEELSKYTYKDREQYLEQFDARCTLQEKLKLLWISKTLHGRFVERIQNLDADVGATFSWMQRGTLKSETEALIVAAQDQALRTRNYERWILKTAVDDRCRICKESSETIDHIVSGCTHLAKKEYLQRHNEVCKNIHWNICKAYDVKTCKTWYHHEPEAVVEGEGYVILYDQQIYTDRKISANRPDIVIKDLGKKVCLLIDVSIPCDNNVISKAAEKILKYRDLAIEIQRMWNLRAKTVPVVIGALGVIPKDLHRHVAEIPGQIKIHRLQDIVLRGTAHVLRRVIG